MEQCLVFNHKECPNDETRLMIFVSNEKELQEKHK